MSDVRWDLGVKVRQVSEVVCGLCRLPYKTKSVPVVVVALYLSVPGCLAVWLACTFPPRSLVCPRSVWCGFWVRE
jgi:hypothetical protein